MRMRYRRDRKKAGGRLSGKPLAERLRAGAAVLAVSIAGCSFSSGGIPVADGSVDIGNDTTIADLAIRPDTRADIKAAPDFGPDKSLPDMGIDSKVPDKGADVAASDMGQDISADLGPDSGVVCNGAANETVSTKLVNTGSSLVVGGYSIKNNGPVTGGITVDISCASSGSQIKSYQFCQAGGPESVVSVPADGKKIRLYNLNNNASAASMTIHVETL
jgi:hypothetical protein